MAVSPIADDMVLAVLTNTEDLMLFRLVIRENPV